MIHCCEAPRSMLSNYFGKKQVLRGTFGEMWRIQIQIYLKTYVELIFGACYLKNKVNAHRLGLVVQLSWRVAPPLGIYGRTSLTGDLHPSPLKSYGGWKGSRQTDTGRHHYLWVQPAEMGVDIYFIQVIRELTQAVVSSVQLYLNHDSLGHTFTIQIGGQNTLVHCNL